MSLQTRTSYITTDEAEAYFAGRYQTRAWDNATPESQEKVLIEASTFIDNLNFSGQKLEVQQVHEFPRFGVDPTLDDIVYDGDIPVCLKIAVCEQALAILDGFDAEKEINGIQIDAKTFGGVKTHYDRDSVPINLKCGICALAWQFLLPLLRDPRDIRMVRV